MPGIKAVTRDGSGTVTLADEAVTAFSTGLRGACLTAADPGYDAARVIWNGSADKRPAIIAQCSGAADVIDAVNFAREHGLLVAVRGGGHNVAGNAICEGGIVIDLSALKGVRVDPVAKRARVAGGATTLLRPRSSRAGADVATGRCVLRGPGTGRAGTVRRSRTQRLVLQRALRSIGRRHALRRRQRRLGRAQRRPPRRQHRPG